jgi:hypothetical protein
MDRPVSFFASGEQNDNLFVRIPFVNEITFSCVLFLHRDTAQSE